MKAKLTATVSILTVLFITSGVIWACYTPPAVYITEPDGGDVFMEGDDITIQAYASHDSGIKWVEFYANGQLLPDSRDYDKPYSYIWNDVSASTYHLTVKAKVAGHQPTESSSVTIYVSTVRYVDPDATSGNNNGEDWDNAFIYLQDALDAAQPGDRIWVAEGIYYPDDENIGDEHENGDPSESFELLDSLKLYGGFEGYPDGNETSLDQRDWEEHETILCGDIDQDGQPANNSHSVVLARSIDNAVLDGFTIQNGNAPGWGGGGLHNNSANPITVANCTFINNRADYYGGGMFNLDSDPTVINCTFINNTAGDGGGGMWNDGSDSTVLDCTFIDNQSEEGGGMLNYGSTTEVVNCEFIENKNLEQTGEQYGAGMDNTNSSNTTITDCSFTENDINDSGSHMGEDVYGGGVSVRSGSTADINDCLFSGNTAYRGGGVCVRGAGSSAIIQNTVFTGNWVEELFDPYRPAGGGIYMDDNGSAAVSNCLFTNNAAGHIDRWVPYARGGAMSCKVWSAASLEIINCTFFGNYACGAGGAMDFQECSSTPYVKNCIFWNNTAESLEDSGEFHCVSNSSDPHVSFCDIEGEINGSKCSGGDSLVDGGDNIDEKPLFEDLYDPSMVSNWRLGELPLQDAVAKDSVGSNNGTFNGGGNFWWFDGIMGGCTYFDGDGDYIDCGDDSSLNLQVGSWGAWVRLDNTDEMRVIIHKKAGSGMAYVLFYEPGDEFGVEIYSVGDGHYHRAVSTDSPEPDRWYYVFATYDGDVLRLYVNGEEVDSNVEPDGNLDPDTGPLSIGAMPGPYFEFQGRIDEVRIYDRALSAYEVHELYEYGLAGERDAHLRSGSQCIDAGDPDTDSGDVGLVDLDGNNRFQDGDYDGQVVIDMGAYEKPRIWYVKKGATPGDGKSWETAFDEVSSALDNSGLQAGDEIWVAEGTYTPGTQQNESFTLSEDVAVYGGFSGDEESRYERDVSVNKTILSGDIGTAGDNGDNSYHVVTGADGAILDGFTIKGGNANGSGAGEDSGGGMYNNGASPTVCNCIFTDNLATNGGGMFNTGSSPVISNCVFSGNWSNDDGGAIYNNASFPILTNCTLAGNDAADDCGGLFSDSSDPTVINSILWGNTDSGPQDTSAQIYGGDPNVTYSCIQGSVYAGTGNIDDAPQFVDANEPAGSDGVLGTSDDGLRLRVNSSCIDAGYDGAVPGDIMTDIVGAVRIKDGDHQVTAPDFDKPTVDMGAYELPRIWYVNGDLNARWYVADNQVSCGEFDCATGWNEGTNWTVNTSEQYARYYSTDSTESGQLSRTDISVVEDKTYLVTIYISKFYYYSTNSNIYGELIPSLGGAPLDVGDDPIKEKSNPNLEEQKEGAHTYEYTATSTGDISLEFIAQSSGTSGNPIEFEVIIDFVSVRDSEGELVELFEDPEKIIIAGNNNGTSWENAFWDHKICGQEWDDYSGEPYQDDLMYVVWGLAEEGDEVWVAATSEENPYTPHYRLVPEYPTCPGDVDCDGASPPACCDNRFPYYKRTASFVLRSGIALYGGFKGDGTETAIEDRDFLTNETVLSGDLDSNDVSGGDMRENSFHVVIGNPDTIIDGFTIKGGNANHCHQVCFGGSQNYTLKLPYGGGMYNYGCSPIVRNCKFVGNIAAHGGAMANLLDTDNGNIPSDPEITNCKFIENSAMGDDLLPDDTDHQSQGGAMYNEESSPLVRDCEFSDNLSTGENAGSPTGVGPIGGAIFNYQSNALIEGCVFTNNSAASDNYDPAGGGIMNNGSSPLIIDCVFNDNEASSSSMVTYGGGIINNGGSNFDLVDCEFNNNAAKQGGGIFNTDCTLKIEDCEFISNDGILGGGIYNEGTSSDIEIAGCIFKGQNSAHFGGGVCNFTATPDIHHCLFSGNVAYHGAGISNLGLSSASGLTQKITNCDFWNNIAVYIIIEEEYYGGLGGGVYCETFYETEIVNSIFWENAAAFYGNAALVVHNGIFFPTPEPPDPEVPIPSLLSISQYNSFGQDTDIASDSRPPDALEFPGGEPKYCNPRFKDTAGGDFHLLGYSECIDAGDPDSVYSQEPDHPEGHINLGIYGNTNEAAVPAPGEDYTYDPEIPDDWIEDYWTEFDEDGYPVGFEGADDDYDGDGKTNLEEFQNDTDPTHNDTDKPDYTPHSDNALWDVEPYAFDSHTIKMEAEVATDPTGGIMYYFDETTRGTVYDKFLPIPVYQHSDFSPETTYSFRVAVCDKYFNFNGWSEVKSATTLPDEESPTPDPMGFSIEPYATGTSTVAMVAAKASDVSGVEYKFVCTSGGGHNSDWQSSRRYVDFGLQPGIPYTYKVIARDKSVNQNETDPSGEFSATTDVLGAEPEGTAEPISGAFENNFNLQVDPLTGSATYTIPIVVPTGRQNSEPAIALAYRSGGGNDWCGVGWSLGMGNIRRDASDGVPVRVKDNGQCEYDDEKGFVATLGSVNSRLVYIEDDSESGAIVYRAETDQEFLKFEFYPHGYNDYGTWVVTDKSGTKFYFGVVEDELESQMVGAHMVHPRLAHNEGRNTFLWALAKKVDINGNATYLDYYDTAEYGGQVYLKEIRYNGNVNNYPEDPIISTHKVEFELEDEDRPDKRFSFRTGYRVETNKRLSKITVTVDGEYVRHYDLDYLISPSTKRSLLHSVTLGGWDPEIGDVFSKPVLFEYQEKPFEFENISNWGPLKYSNDEPAYNNPREADKIDDDDVIYNGGRVELIDINGDGLPDRVMRKKNPDYDHFRVQYNTGDGFVQNYEQWGQGYSLQGHEGDKAWASIEMSETGIISSHLTSKWISGYKYLIGYSYQWIPEYFDKNGFYHPPHYGSVPQYATVPGYTQRTHNDIETGTDSAVAMMDIDGDGFPDRVMRKSGGNYAPPNNNVFVVHLNDDGMGFGDVRDWGPLDGQGYTKDVTSGNVSYNAFGRMFNAISSSWGGQTLVSMMDLNGDGLPDRIVQQARPMDDMDSYPYNYFRVQLNNGADESGFENYVMEWGPLDGQGTEDSGWKSPGAVDEDGGTYVSLIDLNGDGLPDRVMRKREKPYDVFKVQFNKGYGFEYENEAVVVSDWGPLDSCGKSDAQWNSITATDSEGNVYVSLFDINGDGLPDRVLRSKSSPYDRFKVQLNTGTGFGPLIDWTNLDNQSPPPADEEAWSSITATDSDNYTYVMMTDINGDGLPDRVMRQLNSPFNAGYKVQLNKGPYPDLLVRAKGTLGGSAELLYEPSTKFENKDNSGKNLLPFPVYAVTSVTLDDGLGNTSQTTYAYEGGYYDREAKSFRGFHRSEIVSSDDKKKTIAYYHQGGGYDGSADGEWADSDAKSGMAYRTEVYGDEGVGYKLYSITLNKVEAVEVEAGTGWYFPYIEQTIKMDYEGATSAAGPYRAKARQSRYDVGAYDQDGIPTGNIIRMLDLGEVTNVDFEDHTFNEVDEDDRVYTRTEYESFPENPDILNKINKVHTSDAFGGLLKEDVFEYNHDTGAGFAVGNLIEKKSWQELYYALTETYDYDQYGNRTHVTNQLGVVTVTEYDDEYHMYPETVTKGDGEFVTTTYYDERSGLPELQIDMAGMVTKTDYDAFHRITSIRKSEKPWEGGDILTPLVATRVEYNVDGIKDGLSYNLIHQRFKGYDAYTYHDGFGREIQTRVSAESGAQGGFRVTCKSYNEAGEVSFTTLPFFDSGSDYTVYANFETTRPGVLSSYDSIGRIIEAEPTGNYGADSPVGPSITQYRDDTGNPLLDIWVQITVDAENKTKKQYFDARGNVVKVVEVIDPGDDIVTEYEYDELGQLTKVKDHSGNEIVIGYDKLGNKTSTDDPDMGHWEYQYDVLGRLFKQFDARNNKIETYYDYSGQQDPLGRMTKKEIYKYPNLTTPDETITYTYDNYDQDPDPNEEDYILDNDYPGHKGLLYKVDSDKEGWVKKGYDDRCRENKVTYHLDVDGQDYTVQTSYDSADRIEYITYPDNGAQIQYSYDSAGHLDTISSVYGVPGGSATLYHAQEFDELEHPTGIVYGNGSAVDYEYYKATIGAVDCNTERLKKIHTYKTTDLQELTYTYDKVSNVKSITDAAGLSHSSTLSSITYDDLHRLTSLYSNEEAATISYTYSAIGNILTNGEFGAGTYLYEGSGHTHSQPHAVTSANGKDYQYDECGNMTSRDTQTGTQSLEYDALNRLIEVAESGQPTVTFGYGEGKTRLWKKSNTAIENIWISNLYEKKGSKELCHVLADGRLVVTFEPQGGGAFIPREYPVLAKGFGLLDTAFDGLFAGGRTPVTLFSVSILAGLCSGLWVRRQKKVSIWYFGGIRHRTVALVLVSSLIVYTTPGIALASEPLELPTIYYYHNDHLGSSSVMTDSSGTLVRHYGYSAYGDEMFGYSSSYESPSNRYTGQILDEDTGLYFYGARYYDPELARFVQADTVIPDAGSSQALNRYSYVKNNPLKYVDPTGHSFFSAFGSGGFGSFGSGMSFPAVFGGNYSPRGLSNALTGSLSSLRLGGVYSSPRRRSSYGVYTPPSYSRSSSPSYSIGGNTKSFGGNLNFDMKNTVSNFGSYNPNSSPINYSTPPSTVGYSRAKIYDFAEIANAWVDYTPVKVINSNSWNNYLSGVRKKVRGTSRWNPITPAGFDTYLNGRCLDNDQSLYLVEPLMKLTRGAELNYVGQGMLYNFNSWYMKPNTVTTPTLWKGFNMMFSNKYYQAPLENYKGRDPYTWPTKDEYFFTRYGFNHFKE